MSVVDKSKITVVNNTTTSYTIGKKNVKGKISFEINGKKVKAGDLLEGNQRMTCTVEAGSGTKGDAKGTLTLAYEANETYRAGAAELSYEFATSDPFGKGTVRVRATAMHPLWISKVYPSNKSGNSSISCVIPSKGQFWAY